jgi:hypothetical protein
MLDGPHQKKEEPSLEGQAGWLKGLTILLVLLLLLLLFLNIEEDSG